MPVVKRIYSKPYREYWLVFTDGSHWMCKLLKWGYSHCYVITRDEFNWIKIEPEQGLLRTTILPFAIDEDAIGFVRPDLSTVLKVTMYRTNTYGVHRWWGLTNCQTFVQYILGVKFYTFTPYRLYKRLLRLNRSEKDQQGIVSTQLIA